MYSCRYTVLVHDVIPDVISSVMLVGMQRGQVKHVTSIPQVAPFLDLHKHTILLLYRYLDRH
jgi:hypothetical protein